jgi:hypothetical protein
MCALLEFMFGAGMFEHSDRDFESWSGYGCMSAFVCAAFFCLEAVMDWFPVYGLLLENRETLLLWN